MRVICWVDTFLPVIGGMEIQVARLLPALHERGHDFLIISGHHQPEPQPVSDYLGLPIYRFPFGSLLQKRDLHSIAALCEVLADLKRRFQPDLVHIHSGFFEAGFFFYLRTQSVSPAPALVTLHGAVKNDLRPDSILGRVVRESDWVVGVSEATLAPVLKVADEISPRSSVIYNGLPFPELEPTPLPFDPPRLLCFGRLITEKGFDLAIAALALLRAQGCQVQMVVAGDGPARPALEAQTAALGLTEWVKFTGWVEPEAIPALINEVTLVVVPSRKESFGLVALQAAQMARPTVAAHIGGLPEVVVEGETGLIFKSDDSADLARAIGSLLENPAQTQHLGDCARQRALEKFSLDQCADAYEALYRRLGQDSKT